MMKKVTVSKKCTKKRKTEEVSEGPIATKMPRTSRKKFVGRIEETPIVDVDSQISVPTADELINAERLADELVNAAKTTAECVADERLQALSAEAVGIMDSSVLDFNEKSEGEGEKIIPKVAEKATKSKVAERATKRSKVAEKATNSKVVGPITPLGRITLKQLQDALMSGDLVLEDADLASTLQNLSQRDLERHSTVQTSTS